VGQLVVESPRVIFAGEVAARASPAGDCAGDAADHLLDRALPFRRADLAPEVLLGDDVGRVLRPALGELDVALLEGDTVAVADARVAQLPLDGLERVRPRGREKALDRQRLAGYRVLGDGCLRGWIHRSSSLLRRRRDAHLKLLSGSIIVPLESDGKGRPAVLALPLILGGRGPRQGLMSEPNPVAEFGPRG
jgi:hypothetical protein